jgi:hypothetical protein
MSQYGQKRKFGTERRHKAVLSPAALTGRDALEVILDAEYAVTTAHAIDSTARLLYRMHRKQADHNPLTRIRFGDYPKLMQSWTKGIQTWRLKRRPCKQAKLCASSSQRRTVRA